MSGILNSKMFLFSYGKKEGMVLNDINVSIAPGGIVALVGIGRRQKHIH